LNNKQKNSQNELSLEEAKILIGDPSISDADIIKIINDLKILCEVAADLYRYENAKRAA
jgi:hypothetical protein